MTGVQTCALPILWNGTEAIILNNISTDTRVNFTTTGITTSTPDGDVNISYNYDRDRPSTTALFSARDATDDFVTWLPVIIIIIAAAIILGLVMKSFKQ